MTRLLASSRQLLANQTTERRGERQELVAFCASIANENFNP